MQADFSLGVSIFKREDETLPEYFMSFSPMAPFFGVQYRFAPVFGLKTGAAPVAAAKPRPKRRTAAAKMIEAVADPAIAVAPAPIAEAAIAVVDAAADIVEATETPMAAAAVAFAPETPPAKAKSKAKPKAKPKTTKTAAPAPAPAEPGKPAMLYASKPDAASDLKLIKGIGPKLEKELNGLGLYTFAQMATLTPDNLTWVDNSLSAFKGRSLRDDWVGQAAALLEG
ncbi:MAG: hypothetical protein AAF676_10310 [Pseudomonadota bacterium]